MRRHQLYLLALIGICWQHGTLPEAWSQLVEEEFGIAEDFAEEFGEEFEEEFAEEEDEDELESDRDSFTRSPRLMAPGRTMAELSYTFLEQDAANDGHLYPDLLIRYGTSDWLELRLGWTYEESKFEQLAPPGAEPVEEGILIYGAKFCLTKECCAVPASALIVTGYTPTSGPSNDTDVGIEYVFGWNIGEWAIDGQLHWASLAEEEDRFQEWAPSVVVKRNVPCGRANVHVEYFSLLSDGREEEYQQHYFGPGIHFLVTPNLEIGTRVFWGLSDDASDFIANAGVAARF